MVLVLMGVAGSGKTTIGKLLAARLHWSFEDADDFHPKSNRMKMQQGIPLTDEDRIGWLDQLAALIQDHLDRGQSLVLACSALRTAYRARLGVDHVNVRTVYLKIDEKELSKRLARRKHSFFNPDLLRSQLDILEEPSHGLVVTAKNRTAQEQVNQIAGWVRKL